MNKEIIIDGVLKKQRINGGVKYTCERGRKVFDNIDKACDYCDLVERLTGVILTIR